MKFSGELGYMITEETDPGVWQPSIIEKHAVGDILQSNYKLENPSDVNLDLNLDLRISIVMNSYIKKNFGYIKYVKYEGVRWCVKNVSVQYPRLILTLGGLYNG